MVSVYLEDNLNNQLVNIQNKLNAIEACKGEADIKTQYQAIQNKQPI